MNVPREALVRMARKAETLDERLRLPRAPQPGVLHAAAGQIVERWRRSFAADDEEAFGRRLSWDGLCEEDLVGALSRDAVLEGEALPGWARELADALSSAAELAAALAAGETPTERSLFAGQTPPPFYELWIPLLRHARARLQTTAGEALSRLTPSALAALESHLLSRCAALAERAVYGRFDAFRKSQVGDGRARFAANPLAPPTTLYRTFVAALLGGQLVAFLGEYSTLARQLLRLVETWVTAAVELVARLDADWQGLMVRFADGAEVGKVTALEPGLSDRHEGGRQVVALTFESGLRLVYKPKDLALAAAYNDFLRWLAARGAPHAPQPTEVWCRPGYGWVAYVAQSPVLSAAALDTYFRRAGSLLTITYLLHGRDLHMDNVIATADGPVLIDVESLVQPQTAAGAMKLADDKLERSVLGSGLVTLKQHDPNGRIYDIGGLAGHGGHVVNTQHREWRFAGTDLMHPAYVTRFAEAERNRIELDGVPQAVRDHAAPLAAGFAAMYRFLLAEQQALLAADGPLAPLAALRTRIFFRPTHIYGFVHYRLAAPDYQRDGVQQAVLADYLNRLFSNDEERPHLWPLIAEERQALLALDVPYFTIGTGEATIRAADGAEIEGYFETPGYACVRARCAALSEEDLADQLRILHAALFLPSEVRGFEDEAEDDDDLRWPPLVPHLDRDGLVAGAAAIGSELAAAAEPAGDALGWRFGAGEPSPYLYSGQSGIALFFAALQAVSGDGAWGEVARRANAGLEQELDHPGGPAWLHEGVIGAANGLGSLVYAQVLMAALLADESRLELAARLSRLLTPAAIAADDRLDIEGGTAGALLALLAFHQATAAPWALEQARACGAHLLAKATPTADDGQAWPDADGDLMTGFAHGAAGIAYALSRLLAVTGDEALRPAIEGAYRFERTRFHRAAGNWPLEGGSDHTGGEAPRYMTAWCNGAPGIGLGRVLALPNVEDRDTLREIDTVLETTLESELAANDHLCCGDAGRIEILLVAARALGRPALEAAARARMEVLVHRASRHGGFSFGDGRSPGRNPTLFRGLAGVGYQLLRLAAPQIVPSILSFACPAGGTTR